MKISGGMLYTKSEEQETMDFLKSQGLNEDQIIGIHTFLRSKIGGSVNLWSGVSTLFGIAIGVALMAVFGDNCMLF